MALYRGGSRKIEGNTRFGRNLRSELQGESFLFANLIPAEVKCSVNFSAVC